MFLIVCFLFLATASDIRTRRIPNRLTFPAAAVGVILNTYQSGWEGCIMSVAGLALGMAFLLVPYMMGGMGAGDVKMLGALGALGGPKIISYGFIFGAILGGIGGAVALIMKRLRIQDLGSLKQALLSLFLLRGRALEGPGTAGPSGAKLPYSLPLAAGTLLTLALLDRLPWPAAWWPL